MPWKTIEVSPAVPAVTEVVVVKAAKPAVTTEVEVGPGYLQAWVPYGNRPVVDNRGKSLGKPFALKDAPDDEYVQSNPRERRWLYIPDGVTVEAVLEMYNKLPRQ